MPLKFWKTSAMSLVAYGSSDDSDSEDTSSYFPSEGKTERRLASLPTQTRSVRDALKTVRPNTVTGESVPSLNSWQNDADHRLPVSSLNANVRHYLDKQSDVNSGTSEPSKEVSNAIGLQFDLPKPKKRTEPVKITIPELKRADSDSDEDEPKRKKAVPLGSGGGLSSLLPQPRNMVVKETQRPLVPHALTKRLVPEAKASRPPGANCGLPNSSASPSAIKAAAKSAALQMARQMAAEEEGSEDELSPENYFSLQESSQRPLAVASLEPELYVPSGLPPPPGTETAVQSDAPLDFGFHQAWEGQQQEAYPLQYNQPEIEPSSQVYQGGAYYQDSEPRLAEADEPGSSSVFDDEAFRRLQGKRNRGKEEVKFLEIKGDDQLSGSQQWMTKSISEEKQPRKSFSKKKGDQPTGQQRRKHQITYLIHQAKERELELKNNWAENKVTRRQTQAKYGF